MQLLSFPPQEHPDCKCIIFSEEHPVYSCEIGSDTSPKARVMSFYERRIKTLYSASSWSKLLLRFMGPYFGACLFQHFQILGASWSWQASDVKKKENMYAEEIPPARLGGTTYSDIFELV